MKRYAMYGLCVFMGFFLARGDWAMAMITLANLVFAEMEE